MEKKGDLIAVRPEIIIEARFNLTSKENDIIDILLTQIEEDNNLHYTIDVNHYKTLYNIQDKSNVYGDLKKASKTLMGKSFGIIDRATGNEKFYNWVANITYKNNEGKVIIKLDNELKDLLVQVKKRIYYHIKYTLNFKCVYSKRLYYYLKSFEDTQWRIDNIDVLREKLHCPISYKNFADFKRFVLLPAQREINGNSDIKFKFDLIKPGKKVTGLKFHISKQNNNIATIASTKAKEFSDNITIEIKNVITIFNDKISVKDAKKILDSANGNIEVIKSKYEFAKQQRGIKNLVPWIIGAIKGDYKPSVGNQQQLGIFNNFDQRSYNYDELEKKLLGTNKDEVAATK